MGGLKILKTQEAESVSRSHPSMSHATLNTVNRYQTCVRGTKSSCNAVSLYSLQRFVKRMFHLDFPAGSRSYTQQILANASARVSNTERRQSAGPLEKSDSDLLADLLANLMGE